MKRSAKSLILAREPVLSAAFLRERGVNVFHHRQWDSLELHWDGPAPVESGQKIRYAGRVYVVGAADAGTAWAQRLGS
jgi:hypothetical protein